MLRQQITLDIGQAKRGWREMKGEARSYSDTSRRGVTGAHDEIGRSSGRMSGVVKGAFAGMIAFVGTHVLRALGQVSSHLFTIGTNAEETESKFTTTFGRATQTVRSFVEENASLLGMTERIAQQYTSTAGAIVRGMKASEQESAAFAVRVAGLAGDLQSFHDVPVEETFNAIRSGISGESEPLKRFGIILREDDVAMRALMETGKSHKDSLTELEKTQARLNLIYEKAGVAVGDLERTQDSTANTARRLAAEARQIVEDFSTGLIPAYDELLARGRDLLEMFKAEADALGGAFASSIVRGTELVVDMGIATGRTGSAVLALLDALSFFGSGGSVTESVISRIGQMIENFMNLHALVRGTIVVFHEMRAALLTFRADVQRGLGMDESAAANFMAAKEAEAAAEAQREIMRQERAANLDRKREREERRQALEKEIEAAKELSDALSGDGGPTGPKEGIVQKAQDVLEKLIRAQQLRAQLSDEERKALQRVFDARDEILTLEKLSKTLGEEKLRDQMEAAKFELRAAELALGRATEVREAYRDAAAEFEALIAIAQMSSGGGGIARGVQGPLGAAGTLNIKPDQKNIFDLFDGDLISDRALRNARLTEHEAERLAHHLSIIKTDSELSADALNSMATSIRIVTRLADVFGDLSDETRQVADGVADIMSAMASSDIEALAGLSSAMSTALPLLGIAAGASSIASGIINALIDTRAEESAERKEHIRKLEDLQEALEENSRAIKRFTKSLFEADVVGSGITQSDIDRAREVFEGMPFFGSDTDPVEELQNLVDLGIIPQSILDMFQELLEQGKHADFAWFKAIEDFDLEAHLARLEEQIGTFGDTFGGLIRELQIRKEGLGQSLSELSDVLLGELADLEIDDALKDFITNSLAGIDLSTPEGQKALQELLKNLRLALVGAGPISLGDLDLTSFEEMEDLIRALEMLASGDSGSGEITRGVQIARSITEIQANEMVVILDEMLLVLKQIRGALGGELGVTTGNLPPVLTQVISTITTMPSMPVPDLTRQFSVDVGGVTVTGVGGAERLSERDIDSITRAIANKLRQRSADPISTTGTFRKF